MNRTECEKHLRHIHEGMAQARKAFEAGKRPCEYYTRDQIDALAIELAKIYLKVDQVFRMADAYQEKLELWALKGPHSLQERENRRNVIESWRRKAR